MAAYKIYERNGYYLWVTGIPLDNGKWGAYAWFERRTDHNGQEFVPAVRAAISGERDSRHEAETVGKIAAFDLADRGVSGL